MLELLQHEKAVSIIGNYDLKVLSFPRESRTWKSSKKPHKYAVFKWNYESLTKKDRKYLETLPEQVRVKVCGMSVLMVHGSADSIEEPLGPQTRVARLKELAESCDVDVFACGHSHEPFAKKVAATCFVNPGSIGMPSGDSLAAHYAVLSFANDAVSVRHRQVEYDAERVKRAMHAAGLPREFAGLFRAWKNKRGGFSRARSAMKEPKPIDDKAMLDAVMALARRCNYEAEHTHQVTMLALKLFDELAPLHRMGKEERGLLRLGSLLHDIGWMSGQKGHHKSAMRLIMSDSTLPLDPDQKKVVALIARYHRKSLPKENHEHYGDLGPAAKCRVSVLAGILRIADGLDRSHGNRIRNLHCTVDERRIILDCDTDGSPELELWAAGKKADLLERHFRRNLVIRTG